MVAAFPDVVPGIGHAPHAVWADAFLLHASIDRADLPLLTWSAAALAACGVYGWVLGRWTRARRLEVRAGMTPGIGLGGDALLRPQRPPYLGTLAHARDEPTRPPQVILLHGLGASRRVWDPVSGSLRDRQIPNLRPDLLGFGASRSIGTSFTLDDHVTALVRLLDDTGARSVVTVGHSFGCAVAVALAVRSPERVRELVLVCPPVFRSAPEARARLGHDDWLARQVVNGSPAASVACSLMCLLRRPAAAAVARAAQMVPEDLARDGVEHSWPSYRGALQALLETNPLPHWITGPQIATTVVLGSDDARTPAADVLNWPHERIDVVEVTGGHLLPLTHPEVVTELVKNALRRRGTPPSTSIASLRS